MDIRQQITDLVVTYQRLEKARGYRNDDKGAAAAAKEAEERCQAILVDLAATVLTDLHRIAVVRTIKDGRTVYVKSAA